MLKSIKSLLMFIVVPLMFVLSFNVFAVNTNAGSSGAYQTPTYIPNNVLSPITLASGAQTITMPVSGASIWVFKFNGTCTGLAGTVSGSVDNGVTWTGLNVWPYPAVGTAAPTVSAAGAITSGLFKVNVEAIGFIQINLTALTANNTCILTGTGSGGDFNATQF